MKPTIIYAAFAVLLLGGYWFKRPMLKYLLQSALEWLTERGWLLLSRNWGLFFAALGVANHVMYEMIQARSEEHTSELQSLMRISYAVFCLKKKNKSNSKINTHKAVT